MGERERKEIRGEREEERMEGRNEEEKAMKENPNYPKLRNYKIYACKQLFRRKFS